MEKNDKLVSATYRGVLIVNIVSLVSAIAAVMIDSIITGQFLGSDAMASMGLIQPVVMLFNLVGTLFGPGLNIVCTRYMGMAKLDRVAKAFSLVVTVIVCVGVASAVMLFFFSGFLANLLGAKTGDPMIVRMVEGYFKGFSIGLPFLALNMCLSGLMMVDNDKKLGVISLTSVLLADVTFDLLNVLVFHGGMLGMAVATSLSNIIGFLILLTHFLKKERVLRYRFVKYDLEDLKEVVLSSIPSAITSSSSAIRNLVFNALLLSMATKLEISALSVTNGAFSIVISIAIAFNLTTSVLGSLFYGEEDKRGIELTFKLTVKTILIVFAVIAGIYIAFSGLIAGMFLKTEDMKVLETAAFFIKFMVLQYLLMCISYAFTGIYQGTRYLKANYALVLLRETVLPIISAVIFGKLFGVKGVGYSFTISGVLTILCCYILPMVMNKKIPRVIDDFILVKEDFGALPEDTFEASISDMNGVIDASRKTMEFYKKHNADKRTTQFVSLFLEEMLGNIIQHGYAPGKEKFVDIRVIYGENKQTIRIRDNGNPFDPVEWNKKNHSEDPASAIGIKVVMGLTKDVRYVPAMNMNNLMLIL